ncbi:IS1 family transposase, partial [Bifidobacterium pseudolongum]|uniref:IS1 family transposase n=1 Tax=Bifidobacterium pseudolongum TaxID=1694 RepID=UPI00101EFFC2
MEQPLCPRCGGKMKRNGTSSAGRARWRCKDPGCGSSRTRGYGTAARDVRGFIDWLLSADTQEQRHVSARTLRRRNELGWSLWPPCPMDGQVHDVVHLDGIHLGRNAVVPVAWGDGHVLGWYVARRETSAAWMNLMARIGRTRGRRMRRGRRHPQGPQARMAA